MIETHQKTEGNPKGETKPKKERVKLLKGKGFKLGMVVLALMVVTLGIGVLAPAPVEAKNIGWFAGHQMVVYEGNDIPEYLKPLCRKIEYDLPDIDSFYSYRAAGARLYLTGRGRVFTQYYGIAHMVASFITSQPEWPRTSDRNADSVATEIKWHAWQKFWSSVVHIEYFTKDMKGYPYW